MTFLCLQLMLPALQLISQHTAARCCVAGNSAVIRVCTRDPDDPRCFPPLTRPVLCYRERLLLPRFWHGIAQRANSARSERKEKLACVCAPASMYRHVIAPDYARAYEVDYTDSKSLQRTDAQNSGARPRTQIALACHLRPCHTSPTKGNCHKVLSSAQNLQTPGTEAFWKRQHSFVGACPSCVLTHISFAFAQRCSAAELESTLSVFKVAQFDKLH